MPELVIRPYQPADRETLFSIAAGTGYFGEPVEAFLEDRALFTGSFYAYYTDLEPEHAWVACADGIVVGYLAGCADTRSQLRRWVRSILPNLASRY